MHITKAHARRFLLAYQGLWPPDAFQGKPGILDYIRRVGCIQFDPLNIAGHNPELVLQARVEGFRPAMLKELLYEERKLIDGWDKMMSIYCVEDWPYFRRWREAARRSSGNSAEAIRSVAASAGGAGSGRPAVFAGPRDGRDRGLGLGAVAAGAGRPGKHVFLGRAGGTP